MQQVVEKFLAGLMSGIFGSVFFVLTLFTLSSNTSFVIYDNTDLNFIVLILIAFVSILVSNILIGTFYYLFDKSKYPHPEKTIFAIVIGSLAIESIIVPIFLIFGSISMTNFYFVMIIQIIFPIILSQLIIESLSTKKNSLAFSFTLILSVMISLLILLSIISLIGYPVLVIAPVLILPLISIGVAIPHLFISINKTPERIINPSTISIKPKTKIRVNIKHDYSLDEDII